MAKLNPRKLQEGDFVFTRALFPFGLLIQFFVGGPALHVGQAIDKYSNDKLYMAEMRGDFRKDNDIELNSFKRFRGMGLFRPRIIDVRRAEVYSKQNVRKQFRHRVLWQKADYDYVECLALAFDAPGLNRKGMICSGFCFVNGKLDGVPWGIKLMSLLYAPSPEQLRQESALKSVNWRA